jgi:D-3-phosphoglycerate dehydrogenase
VPGGAETKEMINKDFLAKMKPDGVLLNTSRGSVVNDADILAHLNANPNFWYGTDVFNGEPSGKEAEWKCDLSVHERVYGTHHCGASTKQAEAAIGEEALRVILKFAATRSVDAANTVNRAKKDSSLLHMQLRYAVHSDTFPMIMKVFAEHGMCIHEMSNMIFDGRQAGVVSVDYKGGEGQTAEIVNKLKQLEYVHDVTV